MKLSHNIVILDERIILVGENLKSNYILLTKNRTTFYKMSYTISLKKGERGKAGYRQMLVRATVEQKIEISRRLDLYVKDYNKETVTKDEMFISPQKWFFVKFGAK